ncbi:MAG: sensor domain-containing diguanylate cyclase, partial [Novosphingobium sp.]
MRNKGILAPDNRHNRGIRHAMHAVMALNAMAAVAAILLPGHAADAADGIVLFGSAVILGMSIISSRRAVAEMYQHLHLFGQARESSRQIEELFAMTDMLQAADDHDDAGAILMATARRLLPDYSGALYVFNNSRDRLDLAKSWSETEDFDPAGTILPGNCWALKRGKPHINDASTNTLCCMHPIGSAASVEIPMMARGQVFGLLILACDVEGAFDKLMGIRRVGRALADSMSLALSNIALREKLRTQSLRDPLTGLYNRRYMEDALERYVSLAERTGNATSILMIDLDNFKRLNDAFGHAKGDAVLRDVAGQLVGALRPSDVVARYGGE